MALTAAAVVTKHIKLATGIAQIGARTPAMLAMSAMSMQVLSGGRFLLGVGAGGPGFDSAVLGQSQLTGRARVDRYVEFVELLDRVLCNHSTTWEGDFFSAIDARSAPGSLQSPRVPFIVAGNARRSIGLAARFGDGWMTTGAPGGTDEAWWKAVAENCARFDEELQARGRGTEGPARYLSLDAAPGYSLRSVDAFADALGRAGELGFTDVISHWPRPSGWYAGDESILDTIASRFVTKT